MVTIHSEDRDMRHWPHPSEFEVQLPSLLTNVESITLETIQLPVNHYNISEELQNNRIKITITKQSIEHTHIILLDDGFYSASQLRSHLESLINHKFNITDTSYKFRIEYHLVSGKFYFYNKSFICFFNEFM